MYWRGKQEMGSKQRLIAFVALVAITSSVPTAAFANGAKVTIDRQTTLADSISGEGSMDSAVNVSVSKDKAEKLARERVSIPKEYTLQGASLAVSVLAQGKRNVWGLDFVKKVNGKHKGSIYVQIDADGGQLLSFSSYIDNPSSKPTYPLKVERSAAQDIAVSFMKQIAADYVGQVRYNPEYGAQVLPPLTGEVVHKIRYDRIVNDIPYVDNYIELDVDSEGHITNYKLQWDDTLQFPKADSRITLAQANAKLRELSQPELQYIVPYSPEGQRTPLLSYEMGGLAVNALDGSLIKKLYDQKSSVSETPIAPEALGEALKVGNLTDKQAVALVESAFKLPTGAVLSNTSYNEYSDDTTGHNESYWNLNWTTKSGARETGSVSATVDSKTGIIRSYYAYAYDGGDTSVKPSLTYEQAEKIATDMVKKQLPWAAAQLYVVKPDPTKYSEAPAGTINSYYVSFVRKIQGATVSYDRVNVNVDARTNEVTMYDAQLASFNYPAEAPKVIEKSEAIEKWLTYYRTELTYYVEREYSLQGQPIPIDKYNLMLAAGELDSEQVDSKTDVKLVYRLVPAAIDESVFLDAKSGQWRNRESGEVTALEKPKALDVEGHWAQRQLELMVAYKALDVKDGKVRPNAIVTRGELIKMLVLAMNSGRGPKVMANAESASAAFNDVAAGSGYYVYVQSALEQNLIDIGDGTFNPAGEVDREEMAELIVRALGYNTLADYDQLFNINFKDADKTEKKGQAAIVVGLNIMSLSDGSFLPERKVTRAEAATAFFRYLQTRADLKEAPIRN